MFCDFTPKLAKFYFRSARVLIIILAVLTSLGFAALIHAVKRADIGYEDELGFHYGTEPIQAAVAVPAPSFRTIAPNEERTILMQTTPSNQAHLKRRMRKAARKAAIANRIASPETELDTGLSSFSGPGVGSVEKR